MRIAHTNPASPMSAGRPSAARRIILFLLSGLTFVAPPLAVQAQSAPSAEQSSRDPYAAFVTEASQRFGIPAHWIRAVRRVESADDVRAVSSAGAMGLMQVMPGTWAELRVRYGLGRDPYDPRDNILAGTAYLREMLDRYGSLGFLAAYNAGPERYEEYLAGRPLPTETRAYVATLAPMIGVGGIAPVAPGNIAAAAAGPHAWRRAPLFVSPSARSLDANQATSKQQSGDISAAPSAGREPAIAPQSGGLFVARSGGGERP
ncbi:lytic transglycosylase domain-containing protein [Mesorhizobium retamae]|uniref:Lytic transglycosylase domain-containing protein n=1 Tax=Mesorhizobium retamae TaxID=2912854 RepID=A0ABS9QK96_9HYPH|nr:lytic transglycosylase domain-containing protein [Mesorhizobium sp. IRAMC:0171]MCG7507874.1 lytic transglycosylase domain-containing protein [Mesorhizobium sp. IRAMC:0171]